MLFKFWMAALWNLTLCLFLLNMDMGHLVVAPFCYDLSCFSCFGLLVLTPLFVFAQFLTLCLVLGCLRPPDFSLFGFSVFAGPSSSVSYLALPPLGLWCLLIHVCVVQSLFKDSGCEVQKKVAARCRKGERWSCFS